MKQVSAPASWFREANFRLDAIPYVTGAVATRIRLRRLNTTPLHELTHGFNGGIFTPPIHNFRRNYVEDREFGVPFLGSTSMLNADLDNVPLLSKKDAFSPKYSMLRIEAGMTLLSCSGTIGRIVFARPGMEGMWSSGDVLKINPDPQKIFPGYVNAFMRSSYGLSLITSGTYGSIIQHIEAYHVADLPVPRLGPSVEQPIHALVARAAELRDKAVSARAAAVAEVLSHLQWHHRTLRCLAATTDSSALQRRMDAFHHSDAVVAARRCLKRSPNAVQLCEAVEEVFEPGRGPRLKVDDASFGVPFHSSSSVFRLDPQAEYLVSRKRTPNLDRLLVTDRDLLVPRSGQLGGIIGRAVVPFDSYLGDAASEHLVRVRARSREDAHYLWGVFASEPGYYATIGTAYGSSIPSLDCGLLGQLFVPWLDHEVRQVVAAHVGRSVRNLTEALEAERKAVRLLEQAIEEAA